MQGTVLDPEVLALWQRLQGIVGEGLRSLQVWQPRDGLPFASPTPVHQHTVPTLVLGLSGVVRIQGATAADLLPSDLLLIEPGCWHDHVVHKPGSASFHLGFLAGRCDVLFFTSERVIWGSVPEQPYRDLIDRLIGASRPGDRLPLADELLAQLARDRIDFVDWLQPGVLRMAAHLWNHLHLPLDAQEVVQHAGMGRTAAFDLFKAFFGRTPKQELLAQRLALAKHLLARGFSVREAAERCGFTNRPELTRAYRRAFGVPPTAS
jgi:AraC-like DNA-binding protein